MAAMVLLLLEEESPGGTLPCPVCLRALQWKSNSNWRSPTATLPPEVKAVSSVTGITENAVTENRPTIWDRWEASSASPDLRASSLPAERKQWGGSFRGHG